MIDPKIKYILAIDPGNEESAYALLSVPDLKPVKFDKVTNSTIKYDFHSIRQVYQIDADLDGYIKPVIEMVASYGMPVGREVFETCVWIGRFDEMLKYAIPYPRKQCDTKLYPDHIYRKDEKINLCHSMKAKDGNIRQALIDRFGVVGTKKNQGWFYGVSKDVWSAIAVGVTWYDMHAGDAK